MNNYQKAVSRYNQIMGYRSTHTPGKPTAQETTEWDEKRKRIAAYYERQATQQE